MDADFGVLPPAEQPEDFIQEIDRILDCSDFSSLQAALYPLPPATNHFPAAGGASDHVTLGGPDLFGGLEEGGFPGLDFNAAQNYSPLPHAALPALSVSPSSSVDSPYPATPPDVYGGATAWVDPATLPKASASPLTIDPRLLNAATAGTSSAAAHPGLSTQGLPAIGGDAFACRFGEEAAEKHLFGFRYPPPRDHPNYHRPSHPRPFGPYSTFMLPAAQCPPPPQAAQPEFFPPSQEFAQGSSSGACYPTGWLPSVPQLAGTPLHQSLSSATFLNDATSLSPASLPNGRSAFADGGYGYGHASTSNAYEGMFPAHDYLAHRDGFPGGVLMGPSTPSSSLGKRRGAPTEPVPSKRKAAKVAAGSRPSQKAPRKPRSDPDFRPEWKFTHQIDWTKGKPTWAGETIEEAPENILNHISEVLGVSWEKERHCRYGDCTKVFPKGGALRAHIMGKAHMNLRRECLRCGWDVREDMFNSRHTKKQCDKKYEERMNPDAGKKRKPRTGGGRKKGGDA
ncbi:hypothetical protein V8D89_005718 [Ganoderma adspersum]